MTWKHWKSFAGGVLKAVEVLDKPFLLKEIEATASDGTHLKGVLMEQESRHTWVEITSPYENVSISKYELIRDARELLVAGYEDYLRLHNMESEIRALYPKYKRELQKHENDSAYKKDRIFDDIYNTLIGDTVLTFPEKLFYEETSPRRVSGT